MLVFRYRLHIATVVFAVTSINTPLLAWDAPPAKPGLDKVGHIVVLFLENHGFDNLYGLFPGANGIGDAGETSTQTDLRGRPLDKLPRVMNVGPKRTVVDNRFPDDLPNAPFRADEYVGLEQTTGDLVHRFYHQAAPEQIRALLDPDGALVRDGAVTPDGYAVNTLLSAYPPHPKNVTNQTPLLPPLEEETIGDRLDKKEIKWAWYSGGWNDALAGNTDPSFQFHHQPFNYFKASHNGNGERDRLKDGVDFIEAIENGSLPPVAFYKPIGVDNEHPGYASVLAGDRHAADVIKLIERSPIWSDTVVIVTYDENGGYWDHVAPPNMDRWGPGMRVPTIIISPLAKRGFVDKTFYDTTSILKFIETRFGLAPLSARDADASDLTAALDLK